MDIDSLVLLYFVLMLAGISTVALYYDFRRRRFEPTPTEDHVFRCEECAFVYTDDADVDRSRCPQCGTLNELIKF